MEDAAMAHEKLLADGTLIVATPNYLARIEFVWAFLSVDEHGEGVCAATFPNGMFAPLIAADEERLAQLTPMAERIARESGKTVRLVKFTGREELRTILP
jgi:hypothetical protein